MNNDWEQMPTVGTWLPSYNHVMDRRDRILTDIAKAKVWSLVWVSVSCPELSNAIKDMRDLLEQKINNER